MRFLSFKVTSDHLLLCVFLNLLWCLSESTSTTPKATTGATTVAITSPPATTTTSPPTTPSTTLLTTTTRPPPQNVANVTVVARNESSITLEWEKVNNISTYALLYEGNNGTENITGTNEGATVEYVVSPLTAGRKYNFILFTVVEGLYSTGYTFEAVTAPENVKNVEVVARNENSITLQWEKVNSISTYILLINNGTITENKIDASSQDTPVTHVVSPLAAGRSYNFTLITVFEEINSTGYTFKAVTAPPNADDFKSVGQSETSITLQWNKVEDILSYQLEFNGKNISVTSTSHTISELTAAKKYNFTLFTVFENVASSGKTITAVTAPKNVERLEVVTQNESSITLNWKKVNDISVYTLQYDDNGTDNITTSADETAEVNHTVSRLTAGTKYTFTLFTVFEGVNSSGKTITAVTAPQNVDNVTVVTRDESSITLEWEKVNSISKYILRINNGTITQNEIDASSQNASVIHVVSSLSSGRKYNFTLITVLEKVTSTGYPFEAVTAPRNVAKVTVLGFNESSITLQWDKVDKISTYILQYHDNDEVVTEYHKDTIEYTVFPLTAGRKYVFTLFTEFEHVKSSGIEITGVTRMNCADMPWHVTNTSIYGVIDGLFSDAMASNDLGNHSSPGGGNVSFTGLYPGSTYEVSLVYKTNSEEFLVCRHNVTIRPPDLEAHCAFWAAGYSVLIKWNKPEGVWTEVEVNVNGKTKRIHGGQQIIIPGFQPAKSYEVSVVSFSGSVRSENSDIFICHTDPRGVIAGAVLAVLLFCLLLGLAVYIWLRRSANISREKSFSGGFRLSNKKVKAIPVAKFPNHFYELSVDENRGFSKEYESLIPVGTEQTQRAALNPDNKVKNRFTNVLPYDWCRVKLSAATQNDVSDYINASYMPGYSTNREYIAAQGPLPATVSDFWRMVWEQSVKGIVMVTNCTEGGRIKCEQYWPSDKTPCLYGDLLVTIKHEQKEPNWTLREFGVKHRKTSAERRVKHFHFTAWPDHGVPEGTDVLIRFRGLIRRHIESEGAQTPTVVHCSAGVGRTGTIIALDVLLQQLEKERVVGINGFVRKMRLNRPHMVQTESQYIFLHQCIINSLETTEKPEENIYENSEMFYANATALREFHSANANA